MPLPLLYIQLEVAKADALEKQLAVSVITIIGHKPESSDISTDPKRCNVRASSNCLLALYKEYSEVPFTFAPSLVVDDCRHTYSILVMLTYIRVMKEWKGSSYPNITSPQIFSN